MNTHFIISVGAVATVLCTSVNARAQACNSYTCNTGTETLLVTNTSSNPDYAISATAAGNSGGAAVFGNGLGTRTIGVLGVSQGGAGGGNGVEGGSGTGTGVSGTSDSNNGVWGSSDSGNGVYGTSTNGNGVYGETSSAAVFGVEGNGPGIGVYGVTSSTTFGTGFGVYGRANGAAVGVFGYNPGSGYAGYFSGNVDVTGVLTYGSISDIRLKQNVKPLEIALEKLLQLRGVTWEWKDPDQYGQGIQNGFIAQDVEKVFPQWVTTNPKGFKTISNVSEREIDAMLVESVRTLKVDNDALKERVNALELNRRPAISGLAAEGTLFGFGLVATTSAFIASRRKSFGVR